MTSDYTPSHHKTNPLEDTESGYIGISGDFCHIDAEMRDIEVIRVTKTNIIARGRRYGRQWFLKGLREEIRDSAVMQRQLQKEFDIHSRLQHPSVVQAVGMENIHGLGWCIIQEWVEGITLHEALEKDNLNSSEKRRIMRKLVETVAYLHSRGIVHRDLKPSNVMIRDIGKEIVLIDFGLADTADYVEMKGPAGTAGFISPEQADSGGAVPADDVYSLGVIMAGLTPCYSAIARRCLLPLGKRLSDARRLDKLLKRHDRRPKILLYTLIGIAITILTAFAVWRIRSLERAVHYSDIKVLELSDRNAENDTLILSLKDSLAIVRDNLYKAKDELTKITEYENLKQSTLREGYLQIDDVLNRAHINTFSKLTTEDLPDYTDKLIGLTNNLKTVVEDYCHHLESTPLSRQDVEKIRSDIYNYQAIKLSEYQNKWLKNLNPRM